MKNKKKIIFIGSVILSKIFLKTLLKQKKKIIVSGIISDSKNKINADFADLRQVSKKIPYLDTPNINSKITFKWINDINPDYIFCFGYSNLITNPILKKYQGKIVGFHPSNLPVIRGRNPIIWSIILNKKFSGTNFFIINKKPDAGNIIDHCKVLIKKSMNASDLYNKIIMTGQKRIPIMLNKLFLKNKFLKNVSKINLRKRTSGEEIIDWRMSNKFIHNLVRALSKPYIGTYFIYKKRKYFLEKTSIIKIKSIKESNYEYGRVVKTFNNKSFIVKCGEGLIKVIKTKPKINVKSKLNLF